MVVNPILVHIWGPISIHWYGLWIAIGVVTSLMLMYRDQTLASIISFHDFNNALQLMIVSGYLGGRLLYLLGESDQSTDWSMLIKFWEPGLSILGCVISIAVALPIFLKFKKINILQCIDRIALYAPLVQSFGRIGCFFAGCCYGVHSTNWWAITYRHPDHMAPLHISLHPTQLYSAMILLCVFLTLNLIARRSTMISGSILCFYFIMIGAERCLVDFFRWDRTWICDTGFFSYLAINQWIGLTLALTGIVGLFYLYLLKKK